MPEGLQYLEAQLPDRDSSQMQIILEGFATLVTLLAKGVHGSCFNLF